MTRHLDLRVQTHRSITDPEDFVWAACCGFFNGVLFSAFIWGLIVAFVRWIW